MQYFLIWYIIAMASISINLIALTVWLYKKGFFHEYEYIIEETQEPFQFITIKKSHSIKE